MITYLRLFIHFRTKHLFRSNSEITLGTRGLSRVRREFSVLAEDWHIFGRRRKPRFRAGHYKDFKKPETALEKSLAARV